MEHSIKIVHVIVTNNNGRYEYGTITLSYPRFLQTK